VATVVCLLICTWIRIGNDESRERIIRTGLTTLRDDQVQRFWSPHSLHFPRQDGKKHLHRDRRSHPSDPRPRKMFGAAINFPGIALSRRSTRTASRASSSRGDVERIPSNASPADLHQGLEPGRNGNSQPSALARVRHALPMQAWPAPDRAGRSFGRGELGNTPAVCRKSYVHPDVIDSFLHAVKRPHRQARVGCRSASTPISSAARPSASTRGASAARLARRTRKRGHSSDCSCPGEITTKLNHSGRPPNTEALARDGLAAPERLYPPSGSVGDRGVAPLVRRVVSARSAAIDGSPGTDWVHFSIARRMLGTSRPRIAFANVVPNAEGIRPTQRPSTLSPLQIDPADPRRAPVTRLATIPSERSRKNA